MTKVEKLYEALRNPEVVNFELAEGTIDEVAAHFIVAIGDDNEVVPVALLLDSRMLEKLNALIEASEEDEFEDKSEDKSEDEDEHRGKIYRP